MQGPADTLQQSLQHLQGETAARLTIAGLTELLVRELPETGDGEVAVQNLDDKEVNRSNRIE